MTRIEPMERILQMKEPSVLLLVFLALAVIVLSVRVFHDKGIIDEANKRINDAYISGQKNMQYRMAATVIKMDAYHVARNIVAVNRVIDVHGNQINDFDQEIIRMLNGIDNHDIAKH